MSQNYTVQHFNVVGKDSRPLTLEIEIYDGDAWDATAEAKKLELYDAAMFYGKIEYHKREPIAVIRRLGEARL